MSNLTSTIGGCYTLHTFETLRNLWQQMAQTIGSPVCCVSNADLLDSYAVLSDRGSLPNKEIPDASRDSRENLPQFLLLCSDRFQGLLIGTIVRESELEHIEIEITFLATAIERFLQPLIQNLPATLPLIADPNFVNDRYLENHFAQMCASILAIADRQKSARALLSPDLHLMTSRATERQAPASIAFDRREIELQQQVAQANLLNHIITQIHQTFDLSITLQSAVEQVQTFLHADRLIIYQFEFDKKANPKNFDTARGGGRVAYESIGAANLQSVVNVSEQQDCFEDRQLWQKYRDGMTKAIDNVDREYAADRCMLDLMERSQIKSKLVVPIVVNNQLWGLLIAHQCHSPRHWQIRETQFLQKVAEHLALAIDRAELYAASLWHTQNLEQRVNERTRELRDAVLVAQTANQSKTEFLALLSHELRTPLTSILGLSATLLRLPLLNLNERQQNYLNIIHNSGEHLSELIDDILDFYKLEVGKTFLKSGDFFVSKQIEQVVELVKPKADSAKIDIQVEIIDNNHSPQLNGRDLRFRGDAKRVRQILLNILTNAIKFTPDHGTIAIRSWLENGFVVFEIEDSGIGIEAEQIPRLFKKFHQLDRNFDRDYGGMGLGLAITQQLVELHGGSIEVESVLGSGSTFTVRLAAQPLQISERNDWREMDRQLVFQDPELNPIPNRIILIEHDEDLATFMCDILTAARYQVTWLLSAESSFRQISMFEPNLLIIDLALDANVVDRLLDNIRRSSKIGYTKILAIANKDDIVSPISKQYIDEYLWKQVNPEHLLRKITKLLSGIESRMREEI